MPSELRHLLFRPVEVALAIKDYRRRLGMPLPHGGVVRCGPEISAADGSVCFRMVLAPDPPDTASPATNAEPRQEIVVDGPALAAALILFCRERRIPLPSAGDKALQRFGEQVGLVITINRKQDDLTQVEGPRC